MIRTQTARSNRTTLFLAAVLALGLTTVATDAAIISTADGNGADAMVRQDGSNLGDTNFGADGRIWARTNASNDRFDAIFLRFDISDYVSGSFTGPVTLGLTKWRDDDTLTDLIVYGLNESVDTWIEGDGGTDNNPVGELTYDNAPGIAQDSDFGDNDIDLTEVSVLVSDAEGFQLTGNEGDEITVSDADFLTFLNADTDGLVTFIIARTDDDGGIDDIATKETTDLATSTGSAGDFAPTLSFDGTLVPEPATVALLGLGGLVMLSRKRR